MNHAQATAPLQRTAALQAIYQFLTDAGWTSSVEMLSDESGIAYDPEALAKRPQTLLNALTTYENQTNMAIAKRGDDVEYQQAQEWIRTLRERSEQMATSEWRKLQTHTANVIACAFQPSKDSALYAAGSVDKHVAICSADSNTVVKRVLCSGPVLSLHFNPASPNLLLATCMNGGHSVVDIAADEGKEVVFTAVDHKKYVVCGKFSPDGKHYVTGSHDFKVNIYGKASSSSSSSASPATDSWKLLSTVEMVNNVEAVEWLDSSNFYVSVREDNYLHQLAVSASGSVSEVSKTNLNEFGDDHVSFTVLDIALSPDGGKGLLLATDHHRVILLQTGTSHQIRNFYNLQNDGYSTPRLAWSPNAKYAYVTCQDKSVGVLDIAAGTVAHQIKGHEINVRDCAIHPFKNLLLTCSFDRSCRVWTPEVM